MHQNPFGGRETVSKYETTIIGPITEPRGTPQLTPTQRIL